MVQRLKASQRKARADVVVEVPQPRVAVSAPDVSVDGLQVTIDGLTVTVDSREFAQAIGALAGQMGQLSEAVMQMQAEHASILKRMAEAKPPAPVSKGRQDDSGYDVALVRDPDDNEILGFRLRRVS